MVEEVLCILECPEQAKDSTSDTVVMARGHKVVDKATKLVLELTSTVE